MREASWYIENKLTPPKAFFDWCFSQINTFKWSNKEKTILASDRKNCYVVEKRLTTRTRVGAYTGYNQFRDQLEKIATNTQLYELIMFSDCEGYIGSVVSKKLAQDFQDLEVIAKEKLEERDLNIFLEFKNAFELASHNGCVSFH